MASVTARIKTIKQPRGYIPPSKFKTIALNDGIVLNEKDEKENVHASIIGMVVDYLSRCSSETDKGELIE